MKRSINEYDPNRGGGGGGGSSSPTSGGVGGAKPKTKTFPDKYTFDRITGSRSAKDYKEREREPEITGQLNFGSPRQSSSNRTPRMSDDYSRGGKVPASKRADGIAQRGKTKGRMC
jgi:hypothetical protein